MELNIGAKIQSYRKKLGMSLRELSASTGISASMLSQIENNAVNPSINTMKAIAEQLNIPLYKFFKEEPEKNADRMIVRKGHYSLLGKAGYEVAYKLLTPDVSGAIEFVLMEIPAGSASTDKARGHVGEETAFIMSGKTDIYVDGHRYTLDEGDAIRIPPTSPHRWVNCYEDTVQVIFAVTPPSF